MYKTPLQILLLLITIVSFGQNIATPIDIDSKVFHGKRRIKVVLPPQYEEYPNRTYKVVFLLDAQGESLFNFEIAAMEFLKSGAVYMEPCIIVGVESPRRQFEFLPQNKTDEVYQYYGRDAKFGGADSLAISLRDEVIPFIRSKYRSNNYNIGIGHSLGGTFLTYTLVKFPELFNAVIAISPNYAFDKEQPLATFDALANTARLQRKFLYIAYGEGDMLENRFLPSTLKMDRLLREKQIQGFIWQTQKIDIGSHYLSPVEGVAKGLLALNKEMVTTDEQVENNHPAQTPLVVWLKEYFRVQSARMGLSLPTIEYLNNLAYNVSPEEAVGILDWALQLYPDDSNFYDSMGEFQQRGGHTETAKKYYGAGLKLIENQKNFLAPKIYQDKLNWFQGRIKE